MALGIYVLDPKGHRSIVKDAPVCRFDGPVNKEIWGVECPSGTASIVKAGLEKNGWLFGPAQGR